jgi:hypothetical protein
LSPFGNTSNPHPGLSPRPRHLTPRAMFLLIAIPITVLIIWLATRTDTMKRAASLGQSVSHSSPFRSVEKKPKPPAGKYEQQTTAPARQAPLSGGSKLPAAANPAPSSPQLAPGPAITPVVPTPFPAAPPAPVSAARPAYAPLSYNARHDKAFGGCAGQLILSSTGLQFNCPGNSQDSMQIAISQISGIDENGVRLASGKKLHFSINGMTKPGEQALFTDWFNRLR